MTRLFLGDQKYVAHAELLFPAAAVNARIGGAFFELLSEPQPLLGIQTREQIGEVISDLTGEAASPFRRGQVAQAKAVECTLASP